jgi:uncharacterized protein (TIGR02646 family)
MIRVVPADEPAHFDERVRTPGRDFLQSVVGNRRVDVGTRPYWRRILPDLHRAYDGICAYTCHWIPYDVGSDTVEHFIPKSVDPSLAYEWSNFRLVCSRLNSRKREFQDVVDPFRVVKGMFLLMFPALHVIPGSRLTRTQKALAASTIARLRLNENRSVMMRQSFVEDYLDDKVSLPYLEDKAPVLAGELRRQRLTKQRLSVIMGRSSS